MPSLVPVMGVYSRLYPASAAWAPPFRRLAAVADFRAGMAVKAAAKKWGTTPQGLQKFLVGDPVETMFGASYANVDTAKEGRPWKLAKRGLGQMLLGIVAERAFERVYKQELGTDDLKLEDSRDERNDTDYRVLDSAGKAVFRINIKMHGTPFRRAKELVGLDSEDCFALGTYKIRQGLNKEEQERLPYIFMVATAPNLTGESVAAAVPDDVLRLAALLKSAKGVPDLGKRDVEEHIVDTLIGPNAPAAFVAAREEILQRLAAADWRALSAEKANQLLHTLLWERVYAVSVRGFAQNYPNAELDMHFSLSKDMTPLHDFLKVYKDGGMQLLSNKLARGDI